MKRSEQKLLIFSLIIIVFMFINLISGLFTSRMAHTILLLIFAGISYLLFGFENNKLFNKNKLIKYFSIFTFSIFIFTFALGLLTGFLRSPYNRSIIGIFKNTIWIILFYVIMELLRYNIVKKGENRKLILVLVIILTSLFEISSGISLYNLKVKVEILKFITMLLIPAITKNIVLTLFSKKYGYEVNIIYQLVFNLYYFILPIYPGFDYFITSVVLFIQPIILWALCKSTLDKEEKEDLRDKHILSKVIACVCIFFSLIIIALFSNLFRFWIAVIGTGSMSPTINVGDLIIVDKNVQKDFTKIREGDVLVFEIKNVVYTHRIMSIDRSNNTVKIKTKGDRKGQALDSWVVTPDDIIGVVKFKISYIGYPTVWLNRMIRERK